MTPHYTPFQAIIFTDRVMTHTHTNTTKNRTSAVFSAHSYSKLLLSFFYKHKQTISNCETEFRQKILKNPVIVTSFSFWVV